MGSMHLGDAALQELEIGLSINDLDNPLQWEYINVQR